MNNTLSLTFILTPLLLEICLSGCALDAHAERELIAGAEDVGSIYRLATDGRRLYATSYKYGVSISLNNGYPWRRTPNEHGGELAISDDRHRHVPYHNRDFSSPGGYITLPTAYQFNPYKVGELSIFSSASRWCK